MKKLYKLGIRLGIFSLMLLSLSGCKVKSTNQGAQLTNNELAVAAYLDNYGEEYQTKDIPTAVSKNMKNYQFLIKKNDNHGYTIQESQLVTDGCMVSKVSFDHGRVVSKNFNGTKYKNTQKYLKLQLSHKYSKYQKQLVKLIKFAEGSDEEKVGNLNHEQIAMAIYVENYKQNGEDIVSTIGRLSEFPDYSFEKNGKEIDINIGGTVNGSEEFKFDGNRVTSTTHDGAYDKQTEEYNVAEINQKYKKYKNNLKTLIATIKTSVEDAS
ncbi:hypothetical protein ACXDFG_01655 [Pediococcus pentosaceus]|jgi:hypothetical protein